MDPFSFTALNQWPPPSSQSKPTMAELPEPCSVSLSLILSMEVGSGLAPAQSVISELSSGPPAAATCGFPSHVSCTARAQSPQLSFPFEGFISADQRSGDS